MSSNESQSKLGRRTILKIAGAAAGTALLPRAASAHRGSRTELRTRLTHEYGLVTPLVSAGMAFVGLTDLAAAVTNAGAIGVYGVGPEPPPVIAARLAAIRAQTSGPFGIDFIVSSSAFGDFVTQDHIDIAAGAHVPIVVFHFGLPLASWVSQLHAAGSKVWVQTGDVSVAQQAVALGVDGIVAQGRSAGGHNKNSTIPTWRLVERMRRSLPNRIFIMASGGIGSGRSLVRAIRAGADGGWAGTVFVAAAESYAHPNYKQRLVRAKSGDATILTHRFGPEWADQPQRVLRNRATTQALTTAPAKIGDTKLFAGTPYESPYEMPKYSAIVPTRDTVGDLEEMDMPAGTRSIFDVRRVRPAADIVDDFEAGARDSCDRFDDGESLDED